jgi:hypothetical protein
MKYLKTYEYRKQTDEQKKELMLVIRKYLNGFGVSFSLMDSVRYEINLRESRLYFRKENNCFTIKWAGVYYIQEEHNFLKNFLVDNNWATFSDTDWNYYKFRKHPIEIIQTARTFSMFYIKTEYIKSFIKIINDLVDNELKIFVDAKKYNL